MSELKINGKIKEIGKEQIFDSGFRKLEFVVTTNEQYPQDIKFEIVKDKIDNFVKFNKVGSDVEVSFNIRGNEYNGKYFVNLQAWKVFGIKKDDTIIDKKEEDGDLPF